MGAADEAASLLAFHCEAAGQPLEAGRAFAARCALARQDKFVAGAGRWKKGALVVAGSAVRCGGRPASGARQRSSVGFAWSEGLSADDVKPYAEEALQYARGDGDRKHEALLAGSLRTVFAASGAADDYVGWRARAVEAAAASGDSRRIRRMQRAALVRPTCSRAFFGKVSLRTIRRWRQIIEQSGVESGVVFGLNQVRSSVSTWAVAALPAHADPGPPWAIRRRPRRVWRAAIRAHRSKPSRSFSITHILPPSRWRSTGANTRWRRSHAREVEGYASQSDDEPIFSTAARLCRGLVDSPSAISSRPPDDFMKR